MVELSIIKYFLHYNNYVNYSSYISIKDFTDELRIVYTALCSYYAVEEKDLSVQDLSNLVFSLNPKDKEYYKVFFDNLEKYNPVESTIVELINSLKRNKLLQELSITAYEVTEGKKDYAAVESVISKLNIEPVEQDFTFVTDDLEQLINENVKQHGFRWRLQCLNKSLGSLRKGDFGFVFARPETGKTTFLASEVSEFLNQTEQPILFLNNEEQGSKVMLRVYQAYFGVTLPELYANIQHYRKLFTESTQSRFKLYDSAQINKNTVEALCKKYCPALIIFDQLDKIEGFKAEREDLLLGAKYQWARELAKQYGPVIGVCQADGTGENVRWLTMAHVANAKTAKQAEADWILGIGCIHDPGWEYVRFLNITKNKLIGDTDSDPKLKHGKLHCTISPETARYQDSSTV